MSYPSRSTITSKVRFSTTLPLWVVGAGLLLDQRAGAQTLEGTAVGSGGVMINGRIPKSPYAADFRAGRQLHGLGDMNGDALGDVLISARLDWDYPACRYADRARSFVAFGRQFGPGPASGIEIGEAVGSGDGFVLDGGCDGYPYLDRVGTSLGDFNGDGLADLAIGHVGSSEGSTLAVILGSPSLGASGVVSHTDLALGSGGFLVDAAGLPRFPQLVASGAGDFNGDGMADMILGEPRFRLSGQSPTGRVFVVFGRTGTARIKLSDIEQGIGGFIVRDLTPNTNFGCSVAAAGDVNGDGLADIVIGARFSSVDDSRVGKAYVIFGHPAPIVPGELAASSLIDGTYGFVLKGEREDDRFGDCVTGAGDINRDGYGDLAIGAPGYDQPPQTSDLEDIGLPESGAVYVAFGGPGPWPSTGVEASALRQGTGGFAFDGEAVTSMTGTRIESVGDWDADGYGDLVVGSWNRRSEPQGESIVRVPGRTFIVAGRPGPVFPDPRLWLLEPQADEAREYINPDTVTFPESSVAGLGDINGDGSPDVAVSLPSSRCSWCPPPPSSPYTLYDSILGRVYLLWGESAVGVSSTHVARQRAGDAPASGIGAPPHAHDPSAWADSRAWVDFDAGHGPGGPSLASSTTVTITRHDSGLGGLPPGRTANVQWMITTDRVDHGQCRITLRYTDEEVEGLDEARLVLMSSPTSAGPYVPVVGSVVSLSRNEISGDVVALPAVFAIVQPPRNGDANGDGSIDVADLTALHNVLQGIVPPPLAGDGDIDNDADIDDADAALLVAHLVDGVLLP